MASIINKGFGSNKIITKGFGASDPVGPTTRLQGNILQLTNESQDIEINLSNNHVTTLKLRGIYLGQVELPSVDLKNADGDILQTKTMSFIGAIYENFIFNPHRGVYYLTFHNTGSGLAEFTGELIFQNGSSFEVGFA